MHQQGYDLTNQERQDRNLFEIDSIMKNDSTYDKIVIFACVQNLNKPIAISTTGFYFVRFLEVTVT